jgi:glycopeptide antibiotics resistance protein
MLTAVAISPLVLAVALFVGWRAQVHRLSAAQVAVRVLFVLYLGWIIGATLCPLPLPLTRSAEGFATMFNRPNLVPLASIRETLSLAGTWPRLRLLLGNVVVFVPFGLLVPLIWPRLARWPRMILAAVLFSLAIEGSQLLLSLLVGTWYRMSDIDDVLLNVPGVLLGFGLYRMIFKGRSKER